MCAIHSNKILVWISGNFQWSKTTTLLLLVYWDNKNGTAFPKYPEKRLTSRGNFRKFLSRNFYSIWFASQNFQNFSVRSKNGSLFRNSTIFSSGNFLRKCPYHLTPFQNCWNFWSNGKGPTSHFQLCFISWRKRSNKVLWHSFIANCDSLTEKEVNQEMCEQIRARICVAFVHDWLEFLIHIQKVLACASN